MSARKGLAISGMLLAAVLACSYFYHRSNPLRKYGVRVEWKYEGATSTIPAIDVYCLDPAGTVVCPKVFGGIEDPQLSFRDVNGDGTEDIIYGRGAFRQVVAFYPRQGQHGPRFEVIEDKPQYLPP